MRASPRWHACARAALLAGALLAAAPPRAAAEPAAPSEGRLTLAAAVAMALERGYEARIARLESARAADESHRSRDAFLPKLSVSSEAGYSNRIDEKLEVLDHQGRPRTYGLATLGMTEGWLNVFVDQVLLDLQRWREAERAELAAELAGVRETEHREAIANEVVKLYADALRREQLAAAGEEARSRAEWLDGQAEALLAAGRVLASERDEAALHLEGARLRAEGLAAELREAREALWLAISGSEGSPALALDPAGLPAPEAPSSTDALERALAASPASRALEIAEAVERKGVEAAWAGHLPTVALRGGYSHYGIKRYDAYDDELMVGVDVRVPIFDGFEASDAVAGAEKSAGIAQLRRESVAAARRARVRELARRLAAAGPRADLDRRLADSAREAERVADLALRAGRGSLAACLAARERRADAELRSVASRYEPLETWAELQGELGGLVAATRGAP